MSQKISEFFTWEELTVSETAKRHGISNQPTGSHRENLIKTALGMDRVRRILNRGIVPTSGYRGPVLNRLVGGTPTSAHCLGWAVDFPGNVIEIEKLSRQLGDYDQLILERNGTLIHVSFDPRNRRQNLRQPGRAGSTLYPGFRP